MACLSAAEALSKTLSGAPREVLHQALAMPSTYLGGRADLGTTSSQEDACIAYSHFLSARPSQVALGFRAFE